MRVVFDCGEPYYLPQYIPVIEKLIARGHRVDLAIDGEPALAELSDAAAAQLNRLPRGDSRQAAESYAAIAPHWVVYGNACDHLRRLAPATRSALLYHGIGVKECYYGADLCGFDVRFVEGEARLQALIRRHPGETYAATGFAKLDYLLEPPPHAALTLAQLGLDPQRPTVLYAPTFFPSSIECLAEDFPATLAAHNLIVKPHYFSLAHKRYAAHRAKFDAWRRYPNVHLVTRGGVSILPYMRLAELLVSEASSAIFEFAALNRPVVWCDFYKLRWSYRGPLAFRLRRRLDGAIGNYADIAAHAATPAQLLAQIEAELAQPGRYADARARHVRELVGPVDGQAATRIVDYLERSPAN